MPAVLGTSFDYKYYLGITEGLLIYQSPSLSTGAALLALNLQMTLDELKYAAPDNLYHIDLALKAATSVASALITLAGSYTLGSPLTLAALIGGRLIYEASKGKTPELVQFTGKQSLRLWNNMSSWWPGRNQPKQSSRDTTNTDVRIISLTRSRSE